MIRDYFEAKDMSLKKISDDIGKNYSTFLDQLERDTTRFKEIAILYNKGVLNFQDITEMLEMYR